MTIADYLK